MYRHSAQFKFVFILGDTTYVLLTTQDEMAKTKLSRLCYYSKLRSS